MSLSQHSVLQELISYFKISQGALFSYRKLRHIEIHKVIQYPFILDADFKNFFFFFNSSHCMVPQIKSKASVELFAVSGAQQSLSLDLKILGMLKKIRRNE